MKCYNHYIYVSGAWVREQEVQGRCLDIVLGFLQDETSIAFMDTGNGAEITYLQSAVYFLKFGR